MIEQPEMAGTGDEAGAAVGQRRGEAGARSRPAPARPPRRARDAPACGSGRGGTSHGRLNRTELVGPAPRGPWRSASLASSSSSARTRGRAEDRAIRPRAASGATARQHAAGSAAQAEPAEADAATRGAAGQPARPRRSRRGSSASSAAARAGSSSGPMPLTMPATRSRCGEPPGAGGDVGAAARDARPRRTARGRGASASSATSAGQAPSVRPGCKSERPKPGRSGAISRMPRRLATRSAKRATRREPGVP